MISKIIGVIIALIGFAIAVIAWPFMLLVAGKYLDSEIVLFILLTLVELIGVALTITGTIMILRKKEAKVLKTFGIAGSISYTLCATSMFLTIIFVLLALYSYILVDKAEDIIMSDEYQERAGNIAGDDIRGDDDFEWGKENTQRRVEQLLAQMAEEENSLIENQEFSISVGIEELQEIISELNDEVRFISETHPRFDVFLSDLETANEKLEILSEHVQEIQQDNTEADDNEQSDEEEQSDEPSRDQQINDAMEALQGFN